MSDEDESICNTLYLKGVIEMLIDIEMFKLWIGKLNGRSLKHWFSEANEARENIFEFRKKILLEPVYLRSNGDFVKDTEFSELPGIMKENKQ